MLDSISSAIPEITIREGRTVTTSIAIANFFGKQHKHVLDKIRSLDCSPAFTSANFSAHAGNQQVGATFREIRYYEITKNGFVFLVMGFTGKKAATFKEAYIAEFDRMEEELKHQRSTLFPLDADLYIEIREGRTVFARQARPGESFLSFGTFKELAERAGYLVIHAEDLKDMTIDHILKLGNATSQKVRSLGAGN